MDSRKANLEQARLSTKNQIDATAAQVQSNEALLRSAELNLEYATIHAPIGGRIGDSLVQVGGLVSKTAASPLTTIVPLDPIWVRYKVSEAEYLEFEKKKGSGNGSNTPLERVLADNNVLPYPGTLQNTLNSVDSKTGTLELQATFPNPKHELSPGQFGRVRFRADDRKDALLVPQRAVQEMQGQQSVLTVGQDNKVVPVTVIPGARVGDRWVIHQGLKPGDRVIVEGVMKARPGSPVTAALPG